MKDQFILIYWKDAGMNGLEQVSRDDAKKDLHLMEGISGGILVFEDKEQITIALDWFPEHDQFRQTATYPRSGMSQVIRYYFGSKKNKGVSKSKGSH